MRLGNCRWGWRVRAAAVTSIVIGANFGTLVVVRAGALQSNSTPVPTATETVPIQTHGKPWVGVTEAVLATTDSAGKVQGKPQQITQVAASGHGPISVRVPVTAGVRNLSGFSKPPVSHGMATWAPTLNGTSTEKWTSDFTKPLPVQITPTYILNGKTVQASDVVGKSGTLQVKYTLKNVSTQPVTVSFKGVGGHPVTQTVDVPLPILAIVLVTTPTSFTHLSVPNATITGTVLGGNSITWTSTPFEPLGTTTQTLSYAAQVTNATIPSMTAFISVLGTAASPPSTTAANTQSELVNLQLKVERAQQQLAQTQLNVQQKVADLKATNTHSHASLGTKIKTQLDAVQANVHEKIAAINTALAGPEQKASTDLAKVVADANAALGTISVDAAGVARDAEAVSTRASQAETHSASVATRAHDLATTTADNVARIAEIQQTLQTLPPAVQGTPAYQKLSTLLADLHAANAKISKDAADLATAADGLRQDLQKLATETAALSASATRLSDSAAQKAGTIGTESRGASSSSSRSAAIQASISQADAALSSAVQQAQQSLSAKTASAKASIAAAADNIDAQVAAQQQSAQQTAQKANTSYAKTLAYYKLAQANQLVGGNATGATFQGSQYVITVGGASSSNKGLVVSVVAGILVLIGGSWFGTREYRKRLHASTDQVQPLATTRAQGNGTGAVPERGP